MLKTYCSIGALKWTYIEYSGIQNGLYQSLSKKQYIQSIHQSYW